MTGRRIALLVVGVVLGLIGFGVTTAGVGMLWARGVQSSEDGYLESPDYTLRTETHALTSGAVELGAPTPDDWLWPGDIDVRIDVASTSEQPIFVGIAPRTQVRSYLEGVAHAEVTRVGVRSDDVTYEPRPGDTTPAPPGTLDIWAARAEGPGAQRLTWSAEPGTWSLVIMNADASDEVEVVASGAVSTAALLPLGLALLVAGLLLLALATVLIVLAAAGARGQTDGTPAAVGAHATGPYPLRLEGRVDQPLSRGLWLVKWVALIPHYIILAFLWLAFAVATVAAGFAILFTGSYPRTLFDFNVGVLRWTWRVAFYGYSALGTDQYPPFTLEAVPYPATLDIAYPTQLSRGLVLVKWWLLALPHYLVVAVLAGGGLTWVFARDDLGVWRIGGGGLLGVLVLVAGVVLLFRYHYPQGLFDLVMGVNRWVYRVIAYAALMTDEYPPFRLDLGGDEPPPAPGPTPGLTPLGDHADLVGS